ncbi:MAG: DJ-1/PfpI family protein [bacterium]
MKKMKKQILFIVMLGLIGCVKETQEIKAVEENLKSNRVLMIIASSNFRDEEYLVPSDILKSYGIEIVTACSSLQVSIGMLGAKVTPDILLTKVKVEDYDAIVFVGGTGSSEYWEDKTAHHLILEAISQNKILAAICIAPVTLANAGVLKGKSATVFFTEADRLKEKGANYSGKDVVIDENIITANGPQSAEKFAQAIVNLLSPKILPVKDEER